ncbi:MAG: sulfite exporter TauE/SafE family protein [bacterium]
MLAVVWGVLVGLIFSLIGAAGGILSSFGLITVLGFTDPNSVKPMAQLLTLAAATVFIPGYYRQKAVVLPLAVLLATGGIIGAWLGSSFSSLYLSDMSVFKPWFGALTLLIAAQMIWKHFSCKQERPEHVFSEQGIHKLKFTWKTLRFNYGDHVVQCASWLPFITGLIIAMLAAIFGVGGGFLLVPFMHNILRVPMFVIPATAALAIFVSSTVSVINYIHMGSQLDYKLLGLLVIGTIIGGLIGPKINRMLHGKWLNMILTAILILIGIKYLFN